MISADSIITRRLIVDGVVYSANGGGSGGGGGPSLPGLPSPLPSTGFRYTSIPMALSDGRISPANITISPAFFGQSGKIYSQCTIYFRTEFWKPANQAIQWIMGTLPAFLTPAPDTNIYDLVPCKLIRRDNTGVDHFTRLTVEADASGKIRFAWILPNNKSWGDYLEATIYGASITYNIVFPSDETWSAAVVNE